jgi:hypothetical protein
VLVADLRKIDGSPLEVGMASTAEQLREAMGKRHKMMAAMSDVMTQPTTGREITHEMRELLGEALELLNAEVDAMEKILVEH